MKTLEAGGDRRGKTSAALIVANGEQKRSRSFVDLKVDRHPNPVKELRRTFEIFKEAFLGSFQQKPSHQ
jgi:uncharacterized Ntn-hydrolase superfamily protein